MNNIPIIDFGQYLNEEESKKLQVSKELLDAIQTYGFVYLKNFGISNDLIKKMFELSKAFFKLPDEIKQTAAKSHETFCGWSKIEEEKLAADRPGDLKESFMIKQFGTPWPITLSDFKQTMLDFHAQCYSLAFNIFKSIMLGLNVNPNLFETSFNGECTVLRLIHYPAFKFKKITDNQLRCIKIKIKLIV